MEVLLKVHTLSNLKLPISSDLEKLEGAVSSTQSLTQSRLLMSFLSSNHKAMASCTPLLMGGHF